MVDLDRPVPGLAVLSGRVVLPTAFDPTTWHAHEMLFGFIQAAVAGFLLTAVPNWTGRMPIQGWSLGALALVFIAGRVAVAGSGVIGPLAAAVVDLAFPLLLLTALAREILTGRNWRNLPMLGALAALILANGLTHIEALGWASTGSLGLRLGIAIVVTLISLIGGRIIPSFTRNWLAKRRSPHLPAPADRFDALAMAATIAALVVWVFAPDASAVPPLMAIAGAAAFARLVRWQGHRTLSEPLVWVLHAGFLWVPIGFSLLALGALFEIITPTAALHALTGGAAATMILAVQTRATLGHTGRPLHATLSTVLIYVLVTVSALARIAAGVEADFYLPMLVVAGGTWFAAFVLFLVVYGPMLLLPNPAATKGQPQLQRPS
ncbi:NnrS [alpha proteobacterium BAL199]|nr:NnrS [alpha proteobacterium BAL199]